VMVEDDEDGVVEAAIPTNPVRVWYSSETGGLNVAIGCVRRCGISCRGPGMLGLYVL